MRSDIKAMPWVLMGPWAGISHKDTPKEVHEWVDRIYERSAVQKGLVCHFLSILQCSLMQSYRQHVPKHNSLIEKVRDPDFDTKYADEAKKHAEASSKWVMQGMKDDAAKK